MDIASIRNELVKEIHYSLGYPVDASEVKSLGDIFDTLIEQFEGLGLRHLFEFGDKNHYCGNLRAFA